MKNLGTLGMALFLACITWVYLWSASSASSDFAYAFNPNVRAEGIASIRFELDGKPIDEGKDVNVKITGPRAEIDALRGSTLACNPILDSALFKDRQGTFSVELRREDFKLRDPLRLEGSTHRLFVRYVKLVEVEVPVLATADDIEGRVKVGFRVTAILPQPDKVRVRVPADSATAAGDGLPIQKVTVTGQSVSFTAPGYLRLPPNAERLSTFELTVVIERRVDEPRMIGNIPLRLHGPEEIVRRLHLESPQTIDVEVRGPAELVKDLTAGDFAAYVHVDLTEADLVPGSKRVQKDLRCLLLKTGVEVDITILPTLKPENRQAEVTVLPK